MKKILSGIVAVAAAIASFQFAFHHNKKTAKDNDYHLDQLAQRREPIDDGTVSGTISIPTYDEEESNDTSETANQITTQKFIARGIISTRSDEDYFTFTLRETTKFVITYSGSTKVSYSFRLHETRRDADWLYIDQDVTDTEELTLIPGTYFMYVYSNTYFVPSSGYPYSIKVNKGEVDYHNQPLQLNDENLSKYKMALWQNDIFPSYVKRWNNDEEKVIRRCGYERETASNKIFNEWSIYNDYIDPLFTRFVSKEQEIPTWKDKTINTSYEIYLESVLYVWDDELIGYIKECLKDIILGLKKDFLDAKIEKITADVNDELKENSVDGLVTVLSDISPDNFPVFDIIGDIKTLYGFLKAVVDYMNLADFVKTIETPEFDISGMIHRLYEAAISIEKQPNGVLRIPRYAYLTKKSVITHPHLFHEKVENEYAWNSSCLLYTLAEDQFQRDFSMNTISTYQFDSIATTGYKGKVTPMKSSEYLLDYVKNSGQFTMEGNFDDPIVNEPDPEPEPEVGVTDFYLNPKADFDNNTIELQFDYYDPNDELHDFVFYLNSPAGGRPYYLNKTDDIQILSGNSYNNYVYFDFSNGDEYFYSFSYYKGDQWIEYYGDALVFEDKNANDGELDPEDFFNDPHPYIGPELPYIPPYIGGGSEPWIGGGIGGGFEIPDKPWIGGGIGGGGFDGGLGGGGN